MSQIHFLFDECVSHYVMETLTSKEPAIDVIFVGGEGAPPTGTPDPEVYSTAVSLKRLLVSGDRNTMANVVVSDLRTGGHNHGAIFLKQNYSPVSVAMDLHLIWFCDAAEDWVDRIDFLPF